VRRGAPLPAGTRIFDRSHLVTEEKLDRVDRLASWGEEHGRTLVELAIGWLTAQPAVGSVIAGASTPGQVRANVEAATWRPTAAELRAIGDLVS
jgi:aryl-alcohol dehydrogenase-like predicted oxidoreductase